MKCHPLCLDGLFLLEPSLHHDSRGYFSEILREDWLGYQLGYSVHFCQENQSQSKQGVLRGLHFQAPPYAQAKLIRVTQGEILDVCVDIRTYSPTFGQHIKIYLSEDNKHQLFVPQGFAHGFLVLSSKATIIYKTDNYYAPHHEHGIIFNDPSLAIDWGIPYHNILLSSKDAALPQFVDLPPYFSHDHA